MTPPVPPAPASPAPPDAASPSQQRLGHLLTRESGRPDPVTLHHLEALSERIATAPAPLKPVLAARLDTRLTALEAPLRAAPALPDRPATRRDSAEALAELTRALRARRTGPPAPPGELPSVRRFRTAWQRLSAEDQVTRAIGRAPANAGPLNSHRLVLQSLDLLRRLSPDYLRRFLSQVETLQWLEQANQRLTPVKPKPARRSRARKP